MASVVYFPTLSTTDFRASGFLDRVSAQTWIDKNVAEPFRKQWHVSTDRFFTDYQEYEGEI